MIIEKKDIINISRDTIYKELFTAEGFKKIMPDSLSDFSSTEEGFNFTLKGMPTIYIDYLERISSSKIILTSNKRSSIKFEINFLFNLLENNKTSVEIIFKGDNINPVMKMMLSKPISSLLNNFMKKIPLL